MPRVVSHLIGGLGNQMFQYAAGLALSQRLSAEHCLDISDYRDYHLHQGFELSRVFGIQDRILTESEIADVLGWRRSRLARRLLMRPAGQPFRGQALLVEPSLDYWPGLWNSSGNCYLAGYWQSEKYFGHLRREILERFAFAPPLRGENASLAESLSGRPTVSLHVRRGDYVSNARTNSMHGLCSVEYFQAAVKHVVERVPDAAFCVFSDDPDWARGNLRIRGIVRFVSNNTGPDSYIDMQLMSLCRHNIIANSTFSWWAAWLNSHPDKIVVAPARWFASKRDPADIIPESWVRL